MESIFYAAVFCSHLSPLDTQPSFPLFPTHTSSALLCVCVSYTMPPKRVNAKRAASEDEDTVREPAKKKAGRNRDERA